jgi:Raf kinase inhibitor-like YbhB/YbcL family protein
MGEISFCTGECMKLTSSAFEEGEKIPSKYTCDGENVNPELFISHIPLQAKSLILIVDDPDVPKSVREDGYWVHWIVTNISPKMAHIPEDSGPFGVPGKNTGGTTTYQGPCPPDREHRYFFKVYALDVLLALPRGASKRQVDAAMRRRVIASAELMGRYEKI